MKQKVNPAVIGVAVVILIAFCVFMYVKANSGAGPNQLPPGDGPFKPGYSSPSVSDRHKGDAPANGQGGKQ
jgi:hypothetical protein